MAPYHLFDTVLFGAYALGGPFNIGVFGYVQDYLYLVYNHTDSHNC